jgi:hypothetical protein
MEIARKQFTYSADGYPYPDYTVEYCGVVLPPVPFHTLWLRPHRLEDRSTAHIDVVNDELGWKIALAMVY